MAVRSGAAGQMHERLHVAGGGYGASYAGFATVVRRGDTAETRGLTVRGAFTWTHREAVFETLRADGYCWAEWDRRRPMGCAASASSFGGGSCHLLPFHQLA